MITDGNKKKQAQLGMSLGKANYRLHRKILFHLAQQCGLDICFQCGERIETIGDFSVEHKRAWLDSRDPAVLFFDMKNIAFSHKACNYTARRHRPLPYTTLICANCSKPYEEKTHIVEGRKRQKGQTLFYCGRKCAGEARRKK